ncbi:MAG: 50S ribosomal protein L1 [Planctomycetota bacterium]
MTSRSKRYKSDLERRTTSEPVSIEEGVGILKAFQGAKFDETVDIAIRTGIDSRQANQAIRGSYSLPHGIGKSVRVIAFCEGDIAAAATEAGAIEAGGEELAKRIEGGWLDFDVAIAHPASMRYVGKLGRVLGPQGKMPAPKSGTVTPDVATAVKEFVAGKIEFRNDAYGIIHAPMGKKSFSKEQLSENIHAFIDHITAMKPVAAKGIFMKSVFIKSTMSPSVPLAVSA